MPYKFYFVLLLSLFTLTGLAASPLQFDSFFQDKVMRLDYYHCGDIHSEQFYLDEIREEPYFAGSHVALTDTFNYGTKRFVLLDKATKQEIYSTHYCTLWDEWCTTTEAQQTPLGMPESIVFPFPKHTCIAQIWSRGLETKNQWALKWEYELEPSSIFVRAFHPRYSVINLHVKGDTPHCVDIVLLPEGYAKKDKKQFLKDCNTFINKFFQFEPWKSLEQRVNIRCVWAPSQSGSISIPSKHEWHNTLLKSNYDTFGIDRYLMTYDYQTVRDIAAHAPYDYIYILTNSDKYGGGGIYNFYGIGAGHNNRDNSGEVHVHEFGHQFAGLGDEYVEKGADFSYFYCAGVEPWEANLTTKTDVSRKPWAQHPMNDHPIFGKAFPEGGGYLEKGIWRPYENCLMRTLKYGYCPVCTKTIQDYFDYITR